MRLKPILCGLLIAAGGAMAAASLAQDKPPQVEVPANPETKAIAQGLIEDGLQASHAAEIYADLRRTLREVYIPVLRNLVQGDFPGVPSPDVKTAAAMAKALTFLDYVRRAGDELDGALTENRNAMISDVAEQTAKTAKPPELKDVRAILQLPAVRKSLDAFYAMTKLMTGFSYEDSRSLAKFSAWAKDLDFDFSQAMPGGSGGSKGVPSKAKIAKAQVFIEDFMRLSHLDEMVADVKRFARDVYAETAPMSEQDRSDLREQIDQFEFTYTMQKAMAVAVAPSVVASALTDEQLATLHSFVRSPAYAKAFDLFRNVVKSSTAFTKEDILGAQKSFEDLDRQAKLQERSSEEQDKAKKEWSALTEKWSEILKNRISPETRSGLEQSLEDLQNSEPPI
jgi:hypothetical protein